MFKKSLIAVSMIASLSACSTINSSQKSVNQLADNLDINYTVLSNTAANDGVDCKGLEAEWVPTESKSKEWNAPSPENPVKSKLHPSLWHSSGKSDEIGSIRLRRKTFR